MGSSSLSHGDRSVSVQLTRKKISGFNGIQTHDLCDTGTVSYLREVAHFQFVREHCSGEEIGNL